MGDAGWITMHEALPFAAEGGQLTLRFDDGDLALFSEIVLMS